MNQKTYLITGAGGFVGTNLVKKLTEQNANIRIFLLPNDPCSHIDQNRVEIVRGDVRKAEELELLFLNHGEQDPPEAGQAKTQQAEAEQTEAEQTEAEQTEAAQPKAKHDLIVIHCASMITIWDKEPEKVYDINVNGTKNIIKLCQKHKVSKFIYISSVHAIKELSSGKIIKETAQFDPNQLEGIYAKTKAISTRLVLDSTAGGLNAIVLQPSGIIGPGDYQGGFVTELFKNFIQGKLPVIVNGGYNFVDVRDVCDGILSACDHGKTGECYLLTNEYRTIREMIETAAGILSIKPPRIILPKWFILLFSLFAEQYYVIRRQKPLFTRYSLHVLYSNGHFSNEKARKELRFNPRLLEETIKDTVNWLADTDVPAALQGISNS